MTTTATTYSLLQRIELNASAASVTFSNIPQSGFTDLKVVISTRYSSSISMGGFGIYLNGVTTNQSGKYILGTGSSASSGNAILIDSDGASDTSYTFSSTEIYFPNYTSSNYKSFSIENVSEANATYAEAILTAGLWSSTAAITSIGFARSSANWGASSTFSLYGIAESGTSPAIVPKATGGDIIVNDGTYWYHAFLSSGTFAPASTLTCDALVVAGGGAGGTGYWTAGNGQAAGGGGAGGFRYGTSLSTPAGSYSILVGAGGSSWGTIGSAGANGGNSSAALSSTITSTGGGGGAAAGGISIVGKNGGSGGGGASDGQGVEAPGTGNAGGYSPVEGYSGGTGSSGSQGASGGGGGAGAAGTNATSTVNGAGGVGVYTALTDAIGAATKTGQLSSGHYYYAGGGGGAGNSVNGANYPYGAGGIGGGGDGGATSGGNGQAGLYASGGGGGGSGASGQYIGGSGGSGIVVLRYAI